MNPIFAAALETQGVCLAEGWPLLELKAAPEAGTRLRAILDRARS